MAFQKVFGIGNRLSCPQYARKDFLHDYIPSTDPNDPGAKTFWNRMNKRKNTLVMQLGLCLVVVVVNVSTAIWLWTAYPPVRGTGSVFTGNCELAYLINSGTHIWVNVLLTVFLGAGNYCMQVLVAPSRGEIEKAHEAGTFVDIGTQSIRNIFHIHWRRRLTWLVLAALSIVLHLIWNSAFYSSIPIVGYPAAVVTRDFLQVEDDWSITNPIQASVAATVNGPHVASLHEEAASFSYLSIVDCITAFNNPLNATSKLILVSTESYADRSNTSSLIWGFIGNLEDLDVWDLGSSWMCNAYFKSPPERHCTLELALTLQDDWKVPVDHGLHNATIDHCLVGQPSDLDALCGFHYSAYLVIAVCICTGLASVVIAIVTFTFQDPTIVLMGNALESSLAKPENISSHPKAPTGRRKCVPCVTLNIREWNAELKGPFWFRAVSKKTWFVSLPVLVAGIILGASILIVVVLRLELRGFPISMAALWNEGFGRTQPYALARGSFLITDFYVIVIIANAFQLLLSFLYLFYNNILTRQLAAYEFLQFFAVKDGLLVSAPKNLTQQSSHFLSLLWKYAIPQSLAFVILHWLVSQSVFTVYTTAFGPGPNGRQILRDNTSRIGYSAIAIFTSTIWGLAIVMALLINSFRRYPGVPKDFPSMATNSSALSACCHRPKDDFDAHLFPVKMTIVDSTESSEENCSGRLTLTSLVNGTAPRRGTTYELPTWLARPRKKHKAT